MTLKRRSEAKKKRTPKEEGACESGKVRVNLRIDAEDYERLIIHCLKKGTGPGELVGSLIQTHLREWAVRANPKASALPDGSAGDAAGVNPPALMSA